MGKRRAPGTGPGSLPRLPAQPPAGKGELAVRDAPSRARRPRATRTCVEPPGPAPPPGYVWEAGTFPSHLTGPTPKGEANRGLRWGPEGGTGLDNPSRSSVLGPLQREGLGTVPRPHVAQVGLLQHGQKH